MDIDETVLDNSEPQAGLLIEETCFPEFASVWDDWIAKRSAPAVPGAAEFIHAARASKDPQGRPVRVFFITNRECERRAGTESSLSAAGRHARQPAFARSRFSDACGRPDDQGRASGLGQREALAPPRSGAPVPHRSQCRRRPRRFPAGGAPPDRRHCASRRVARTTRSGADAGSYCRTRCTDPGSSRSDPTPGWRLRPIPRYSRTADAADPPATVTGVKNCREMAAKATLRDLC